jgi:hypothetical protein
LRWAHESISETEREKFLAMAKVWTQLAIHEGQQSKDQTEGQRRPPRDEARRIDWRGARAAIQTRRASD